MARFAKFLILALVGFSLGAGFAWFQKTRQAGDPAGMEITADESALRMEALPPEGEATADAIVPDAPDMPDADAAGEEGVAEEAAIDETAAPAETAAAAGGTENAEASPEAAGQVAGSSVGGAFSLTDHNGNAVTEASWPGKKKLVFFGFTHCPDICPTSLDKMTAALESLGDAAGQIQPLFITTDPARDTPERMKEYLADYDDSILGLTGTQEQIDAAKDAYKVYAAKAAGTEDNENYLMDHSAYIYLMSEDDRLLEIFGSSDTAETIIQKSRPHLETAE